MLFPLPVKWQEEDKLLSVGDAEGEHGEVVVLLGTIAELVGVGLEGLDDVAHT